MNVRNAVRFHSDLFNSTEATEQDLNECCFGEDLGTWLKSRLEALGYAVAGPDQEDWGWYLVCAKGAGRHYLNIGFSGDEWLMFVEPLRSLGDRLRGRNKEPDPQLSHDLHAVLSADPAILDIRWSHLTDRTESDGSPEP